ncbi:MAG: hypothetical protein IAE85_12265 [Anaerolinea sp.]|nr:hypothetical protein [Anaerolinea sp.]
MNTLNISAIEQELMEDRKYWQSVAAYMNEPASMDLNNNVTYDVARQKMAGIDRTLKRIKAGVYGRCEKCNAQIEAERLKTLINADCHLCVHCAKAAVQPGAAQSQQRSARPAVRRTIFAMGPA